MLFACGLSLFALAALPAQARPTLPEEYARTVQDCFAEQQWDEGKAVLDEGLAKYPQASNLHYLMGKYLYREQDYDRSRYHLIKAVDLNYDNVDAKKLLVDVEETTHNYSSAICYVNELLEVQPYWRGLWRRKIELYRKQGNNVEADRLLKRINQIYPQDTVLRRDLVYQMEVKYLAQKRGGERKQAIATLEELLKTVPDNEQYYLDIINLCLQEGQREEALAWTSRGLAVLPHSRALIYKKVGILSETERYAEAMAFLREEMRRTGSPADLRRLHETLVLDAARAERRRDPYVLYGMAFESGDHSREVLDYLLNTALMRGYDDDALLYLRAVRRYYGDDKSLLYKEYLLSRNMGDEQRAFNLLVRLCERYPGDGELTDALCRIQLQRADRLMERGLYTEALPCAAFVTRQRTDDETIGAAWEKVLACRIELKRYDEALATLDTLAVRRPDAPNLVGKRALVLDRKGRTPEAMRLYLDAMETADPEMRERYVAGYAEIAVPYIKSTLEAGATERALDEALRLYRLDPDNELALRYVLNAAAQSERHDLLREYVERGMDRYPDDPYYLAKKAAVLDTERRYAEAVALVRPALKDYPGSRELVGAHSQSSEYRALELIRDSRPDDALAVLDSALVYDTRNRSLLYAKGLAFEKRKEWELAYHYQSFYEPAPAEAGSFYRHLKGLRYGSFRNEIGLEYMQSRYGEEDAIQSVATLQYERRQPRNTYLGRINYAGRNGTPDEELNATGKGAESGGIGIQLQAEWTHLFPHDWELAANLAWADRYFPKWMGNVALTKFFRHDWEAQLRGGYRRLDGQNLYSLGPGVAKTWDPVRASLRGDLFFMHGQLYYNVTAEMRYFPASDGHSYITAMAGAGSAPELVIIDRALPGSFDHVNTMVGLGGSYLFTPHVRVGVLGTWHTYYTERRTGYDTKLTRYKHLYSIYAQVYVSF